MSAAPRVSVLLPARDAAATLPLCLRSLRRQTLRDFECVLVDDGSGDATREIAEAVAREDARFRVVATAPRGLVEALGAGLAQCRAPLVARMDADDWMLSRRLEQQCRALERRPEWAGVGCHVRIFPRAGLADGLRGYERWLRRITSDADVRREAFVECPLPHPTWMLRRAVLEQLGYRRCGWPEDYDLLLRLLARGDGMGVIPERLLAWRDSPGRLWRTAPEYRIERFVACKAAFLADGLLCKRADFVLWGYGETGKALRRALLAHGKRPSHIVELHPRRLGERIHGAPVIPPPELAPLRGRPIVVSVAGDVARAEIRQELARMGFEELRDFVCAA